MMTSIYPKDWSEVAALVSALVPIFIWAGSGLVQAFNNRDLKIKEEWLRLQELAKILYNNDFQSGYWSQILAAQELKRFKRQKSAAKKLAAHAADHFQKQPTPSSELIGALREV